MWLDLAVALSCGGGGVVCGWIMHAWVGFGNYRFADRGGFPDGRDGDDEISQEQVSEVANRLRTYAVSMAADVDAHQSRVQAVNNSLSRELSNTSPEVVLEAVNQLVEANEAMQTQLQAAQERIHEQAVQIETAERRAQTDALTRIPNRRVFDAHIEARYALGSRKPTVLALLDVDHFKKFNDVYGHRAGDEVLRIVAKVLHARLNRFGLVARIGGEEFAIVMDGWSIDQACELIEATRLAIGQRDIQFEGKRLRVAASVGVAQLDGNESLEQWTQRADDGLYRSKDEGRNCGHWMDGHRPVRISLDEDCGDVAGDPAEQAMLVSWDPASELSESVADSSRPDNPDDGHSLEYLPDRQVLGESLTDLRNRVAGVSVYLMAIRSHTETDKSAMQSLLRIVRAAIRDVDRIGCEDETTLLLCMPSMDEQMALECGKQIIRSLIAIKFGGADSETCGVTIGISAAQREDEFDQLVERAIELCELARNEQREPVRVDRTGDELPV